MLLVSVSPEIAAEGGRLKETAGKKRGRPGFRVGLSSLIIVIFGWERIASRRCRGKGAVFLLVAFLPFVVGSLFLFLLSLTLGVGVLVLGDRKLRVKLREKQMKERPTSPALHDLIPCPVAPSYPNASQSDTGNIRDSNHAIQFQHGRISDTQT